METNRQILDFEQGYKLMDLIARALIVAIKDHAPDYKKIEAIINRPQLVFQLANDLLADNNRKKQSSCYVKVISGNEELKIEALDGKAHIISAGQDFALNIDESFIDWKLNKSSTATVETLVEVGEMVLDATFIQMFGGINCDLEKIVMTQAQIICFCHKYPNWLRQDGYATFFLIKTDGEYFVVEVTTNDDGLLSSVYKLTDDIMWRQEIHRRIVYPKTVCIH